MNESRIESRINESRIESRINGSAQKTDYMYRDSVNVEYMEINTPKSQLPEEP